MHVGALSRETCGGGSDIGAKVSQDGSLRAGDLRRRPERDGGERPWEILPQVPGPGGDAQIIPQPKLFCVSRNNMANAGDLTLESVKP